MLELAVVAAVAVALLRGGKLKYLGDIKIKGMALVWLALVLRVLVNVLAARGLAAAPWLQVAAYGLLMPVIWRNASLPGIKIFGIGTLLNFVVIAANGGAMPVRAVAGMTVQPAGTHTLLTSLTRLWFLADIFSIRPIWRFPGLIFSVGDIVIVMGIFVFVQAVCVRREKQTV